jgi:hypothetical protein
MTQVGRVLGATWLLRDRPASQAVAIDSCVARTGGRPSCLAAVLAAGHGGSKPSSDGMDTAAARIMRVADDYARLDDRAAAIHCLTGPVPADPRAANQQTECALLGRPGSAC